MWKDEEAVSPVIATILMVAITVVLAGVLVVYMQQFSKTGTSLPTASSSATAFSNPVDGGMTSNGGGWNVKVISMSSTTTQWSTVTIQIMQNGLPGQSMKGVKATNAKFWSTNGTTKWYAKADTTPNVCVATTCAAKTAITPTTTLTDMMTVELAHFIVIDTDGSNTMTAGDLVLVYASALGTTTPTITSSGGYTLEFAISGAVICASPLG